MTFLVTQIAICLLLAFLVGFTLGWLFREIFRDRDSTQMVAYGEPIYQGIDQQSTKPATLGLGRGRLSRLTRVIGEE